MLKKKLDVKLNLIDFLLILVTMYTIAPIVSRFISSYLTTYFYMLIVALTVVLLLLVKGLKSLNECLIMIAPFVCWKMLQFFVSSDGLMNWGYGSMLDILPLLIGYYFMQRCDEDKNDFFALFIAIVLSITLVTTIIGCIQYPGAARYLATVENTQEANAILYDWKNIGGYMFVYFIVLLHPLAILAFKKQKINGWMAALCSIAVLSLAIYSEYTTALLLTLITLLLYFFKRDFQAKQLFLFSIIAMAAVFLLSEVFSNFLMWLADIVGSETIAMRLEALADGRTGIENSEDNRIELYERSFYTFLHNPLFGTFLNGGGGIGGHSFILDFMAQFGLLGVAVLFFMYRTVYKFAFSPYKGMEGYGFILWLFVQTIILSTVNTGLWLSVLVFFIPIFLKAIYREEQP